MRYFIFNQLVAAIGPAACALDPDSLKGLNEMLYPTKDEWQLRKHHYVIINVDHTSDCISNILGWICMHSITVLLQLPPALGITYEIIHLSARQYSQST